jgi:hypothetical protein
MGEKSPDSDFFYFCSDADSRVLCFEEIVLVILFDNILL